MTTEHFADIDGNYIGGFGDGAKPPEGAVETPAPAHGLDKWDGIRWVPEMSPVRTAAIGRMNVWIECFMASITGDIPATEKVSWPIKAQAARAIVAIDATALQAAIIQAEADVTGETIEDLASIIAAQADQWENVVSVVTGLRRKTRDAINAAPDAETIEAILTQAQSDAAALAAQMGL